MVKHSLVFMEPPIWMWAHSLCTMDGARECGMNLMRACQDTVQVL